MLGNFKKGQKIKIPAKYKNNNGELVKMKYVKIRIEHFDQLTRNVIVDVAEIDMKKYSDGLYLYEFEIPINSKLGMYYIYIKARPETTNNDIDTIEQFIVIEEDIPELNELVNNKQDDIEKPRFSYTETPQPMIQQDNYSGQKIIEDIVVNHLNNPVKGVHVNAYSKNDFVPNSQNNIKLGTAMTDEQGKWKMQLLSGEYVLVFKAIGFKEYREFRRI
jgi:hypothetical protein